MNRAMQNLANYFNSRTQTSNNSCYANGYSNQTSESAQFYDLIIDELNHFIPLQNKKSVLEIGCGTGEILSRLPKCVVNCQGIDISKEMVTLAKDRGLNVTLYDGNRLPFNNSSFDIIIIYQVLTNLPSLKLAKHLIFEANRILKKQGCLFIGAVPDPKLSNCPSHSKVNFRSLYRQFRSTLSGTQTIGYFSYTSSFFLEIARELDCFKISFAPCRLKRSGWNTKYHIIMEKQ